jgi:hypothetical protein
MRFTTVLELSGKSATGIRVPEEVVVGLGPGKRHAITVTIGGHTYRSSVAPYRGAYMIALSAENREQAGVAAGDEIEVDVELDTEPRVVEVPADFAAALDEQPDVRAAFTALSYSNQRAHVLAIESAKTPETRLRRIEAARTALTPATPTP